MAAIGKKLAPEAIGVHCPLPVPHQWRHIQAATMEARNLLQLYVTDGCEVISGGSAGNTGAVASGLRGFYCLFFCKAAPACSFFSFSEMADNPLLTLSCVRSPLHTTELWMYRHMVLQAVAYYRGVLPLVSVFRHLMEHVSFVLFSAGFI